MSKFSDVRHTDTHRHIWPAAHLQLWNGELSIDSTCWPYWCLWGRGWMCVYACVCVRERERVEGDLPIGQIATAWSHGGFQYTRRQGGPGLAGQSKPSLFNSPCPGANKLTPWSGAPHACLPPCLATGRTVCPMREPTAWQSLARLLGTVLACALCVCGNIKAAEFGSFWITHGDGLMSVAS